MVEKQPQPWSQASAPSKEILLSLLPDLVPGVGANSSYLTVTGISQGIPTNRQGFPTPGQFLCKMERAFPAELLGIKE